MGLSEKVKLKIADVIIVLKSCFGMEPLMNKYDERFLHFVVHDKLKADIKLTIKIVNSFPRHDKTKQIFSTIHPGDRKKNWALFKEKKYYTLRQYIPRTRQEIVLNNSFDKGVFYLLKKNSDHSLCEVDKDSHIYTWKIDDIIYDALQIVLINYLAKKNGFFFHSAGLKDIEKSGFLFVGPTQLGKSTTAILWHTFSQAQVLNDDRIIVRRQKDRFSIYGTPWHGDFNDYLHSKQEKALLKKIFFIYQHPKNVAKRVYGIEAFNMLLPNTFPTFWDKEGLNKSLAFCHELVERIPCYKLGFRNDKSIIEFVRNIK